MRRLPALPLCLLGLGLSAAPAGAQYPYQQPGYGFGGGNSYGGYGGGGYGGYGGQSAFGQIPAPGSVLPNFYNPQYQPLSPYLNLLRGGNPAVNYYYGVRPGTPAGGMMPFGSTSFNPVFGPRFQYLPQASLAMDPAGEPFEPGGREVTLRPAGHPVIYGNTFNGHGSYFAVYAGRGGLGLSGQRQGQGAGGQYQQQPRGGAGGTQTTPPPKTR